MQYLNELLVPGAIFYPVGVVIAAGIERAGVVAPPLVMSVLVGPSSKTGDRQERDRTRSRLAIGVQLLIAPSCRRVGQIWGGERR